MNAVGERADSSRFPVVTRTSVVIPNGLPFIYCWCYCSLEMITKGIRDSPVYLFFWKCYACGESLRESRATLHLLLEVSQDVNDLVSVTLLLRMLYSSSIRFFLLIDKEQDEVMLYPKFVM